MSLHDLLNALDGLASQDGQITFLTTNRKDALDPALVRPGRCDRLFFLGFADPHMAKALFLNFFNDFNDIDDLATRYGDAVAGKDNDVSMATLQGHLLLHKDDPHAALATAESGNLGSVPDVLHQLDNDPPSTSSSSSA